MTRGLVETNKTEDSLETFSPGLAAARLREFEGHRTGWSLRVWRTSVGVSVVLHIALFLFCIQIKHFMRIPVSPTPGSRQKRTRLYFPAELVARASTKGGSRQGKSDIGEDRLEAPRTILRAPILSERRRNAPTPQLAKPAPEAEAPPEPIRSEVAQPLKPQQSAEKPNGEADTGPAGTAQQSSSGPPAGGTAEAAAGSVARVRERVLMPGSPSIQVPDSSVSNILKDMAKGSSQSPGVVISGDGQAPTLNAPAQGAKVNLKPVVELKSDPQGTDFKPYLTQILAIVRRNWFSVLPRSAQMGTLRGSTVIQFMLNRDGSIPKLVIADSSGLQPLDRAAIAGLSMSNPLPPLPEDFKGGFIRLQFIFNYNIQAK